ncbi:F-box/LRR-repeat protein 25-like [Rhodamnia argentea]|uniref:F-box/LRR-repeat protein 25-like n=1 Tax=Rhodamnia argentea TaxID=178133 RepID=A0ABM3H4B3_9MYRT|nr:F-box/LRR-repeat protein 25-like [Rhodamnia argentea]
MAPLDANPDLSSPPQAVEVDNISPLPDVIIHHIFCFLPFKDLVKTSVLSKQWRLAWTSTPNIDVSLRSWLVIPLISKALSLCTATKIEKFHVDFYVRTEFDLWFHFAAARQVEDASLVFGGSNRVVPQFMCDCTSLVSLRISKATFPPDFTIHWPSLKKLCLHDFIFDYFPSEKDVIMKIMRGCPVLESFTLRSSWLEARDIWIDSRSLRELVIEADISSSLILSAPNLLSLCLSAATCHENHIRKLVSSGTELILFGLSSWVLSRTGIKGRPYLSSRWRNIVVYTTVCKSELKGIAFLLRSSPLLERLAICNPKSNNARFRKKDFPKLCNFVEKQFGCSRKDFPCVANQLKRVEIVGFEFNNEKSKLLRALSKFLLEETVELEKIDNPC